MTKDAPTPAEISAAASAMGRLGAHTSWANTKDRSKRTAPARAALEQKFLDEAGGDPVRAEHVRKAYYLRLALKSAETRRANRDARLAAKEAERQAFMDGHA